MPSEPYSRDDMTPEEIQAQAEGLPYHTILALVMHKYNLRDIVLLEEDILSMNRDPDGPYNILVGEAPSERDLRVRLVSAERPTS